MDQSPAVPSPQKGDPITAEWAQKVADAANAVPKTPEAPGAFSSPFGSVAPAPEMPMLGTASPLRLFECRVVYNSSTDKYDVYCCIPNIGILNNYRVFAYNTNVLRSSSQAQGTSSNPWVNVGSVAHNKYWWLALCLEPPTNTDYHPAYRWRLAFQTYESYQGGEPANPPPTLPTWAWEQSPYLPIAYGQPGASALKPGGFIQLHTGIVLFGTPAFPAFATSSELRLQGIGDRLGNAVAWWQDSGATPKTYIRNLEIGGSASYFNGQVIGSQTITDGGGNSVTVLTI